MRYTLSVIIVLLFLTLNTTGQSIPTYWMNIYNLENYYESRNDDIEKITVNKTGFYSSGETYNERWIFHFNEPNKIDGEFYKNGKLKSNFTYEFDEEKRLVKKKVRSNRPLVGWTKEIFLYEYLNENKIVEKHFNENEELIRFVNFIYDDYNNPVKLTIVNLPSLQKSYETADYNYQNSSYKYSILNTNGDLVLEETNYCNTDTTNNTRNELGDFTKVAWGTSSPNRQVFHTMDYKYDNNGNWIKRVRTVVSKDGKNKHSIIKRKIEYRKTSHNN